MGKLDGRIDASLLIWTRRSIPARRSSSFDHDEIVYSKCYGLADVEAGDRLRPTRVLSGLDLQEFTTMAIMLLAEQGRLGYEDRLPAYFPQFPAGGAEISLRICCTTRRVCAHYMQFFSSNAGSRMDPRCHRRHQRGRARTAMDLSGPEFPVGSQYAYGGTGYNAAGDDRGDCLRSILRQFSESRSFSIRSA